MAMAAKTIVLIRHGESEGQACRGNGIDRSDPVLRDCAITRKGAEQARTLRSLQATFRPELIVCSPLKRAIETAILGFPDIENFVMHPLLCERGSKIPENQPRPLAQMIRDRELTCHPKWAGIDRDLMPEDWPQSHTASGGQTMPFLAWLAARPEQTIAVVCHHNTIQHFIGVRDRLLGPLRAKYNRIENCNPVHCLLQPSRQSGVKLVLQEEHVATLEHELLEKQQMDGGGKCAKQSPSLRQKKGKGKGKGKKGKR